LPEDDRENEKQNETREHEERVMAKTAELIAKYGMEGPAIFALEVIKPLAYVGGQFARFFLAPFLPIFGDSGDSIIATLEQQDNIEKIISMIEKKEREKKKAQSIATESEKAKESDDGTQKK